MELLGFLYQTKQGYEYVPKDKGKTLRFDSIDHAHSHFAPLGYYWSPAYIHGHGFYILTAKDNA